MTSGAEEKLGLFSGLCKEHDISESGLMAEMEANWSLPGIPIALEDIGPWRRGGSETYVAEGRIGFAKANSLHIIGKAFVGWGLPPERQQGRWESRRKLFLASGINISPLVFAYSAMSIEHFVSDPVLPETMTATQAYQLGQIFGRLNALGYSSMNLLSDIRREGEILSLVDLGTDISQNDDIQALDRILNIIPFQLHQSFIIGTEDLSH